MNSRWGDLLRDPVLIGGTAISVFLGVLFYVRSDTKTALGVFAGLIGVVITLQIQAILLVQRKSVDATRYARIEATLDEIHWLAPLTEDIVNKAANVDSNLSGTPGIELCQQIIEECRGRLVDLEHGHYEPTYGDQRLFLDLTRRVQTIMRATSAQGVDLSWWTSPRSQEYWRLHREALARNVAIKRIFIFHDWTPELETLAATQHSAGIEIRRIHSDHIPADLNADIVVWDDRCGYETRSNAAGAAVRNFYTLTPHDVQALIAKFDRIFTLAETYVPEVPAP